MTDELPSIEEQVANALNSRHLQYRPGPCHLDKVAALGAAQSDRRLSSDGLRLKLQLDPRFYAPTRTRLIRLVKHLSRVDRWQVKNAGFWIVFAREVLDYWLCDICPQCTGLGYEIIPGTPVLSPKACPGCGGTKHRAYPMVGILDMNVEPWRHRFRRSVGLLNDEAGLLVDAIKLQLERGAYRPEADRRATYTIPMLQERCITGGNR
jgi:hypothetical protein